MTTPNTPKNQTEQRIDTMTKFIPKSIKRTLSLFLFKSIPLI